MKKRNSNLKSFKITNLFGDRDIKIDFKDDIKILIGENGLGKTTVLNILYYILSNKFYGLKKFDFQSLELLFTDGEKIFLEYDNLISIDEMEINMERIPSSLFNYVSNNLDEENLAEIADMLNKGVPSYKIFDKVERKLMFSNDKILSRYSPRLLMNIVKSLCGVGHKEVNEAKQILNRELIETEVLYFPTFRRIEEDLYNLGFDDEKNKIGHGDSRLIQFGMSDVKERLEDVKNEINTLSSKGFSQISSEILSQLVKGIPEINHSALQNIKEKDINIILTRVGEAITFDDKTKILSIVSGKKLKEIDDKYLVYFLQKLVTIYEKQREIDNSIESFVSVCNNYLSYSNKEIQYEASEVDFYMNINKKRVRLIEILSKLSSGEKQIISLFSKIYLSKSKNFIVLFDEPELSLSLYWQKILLPDIVKSKKCKFLLSVTHSPFIFENELQKYAVGLNQYIKIK